MAGSSATTDLHHSSGPYRTTSSEHDTFTPDKRVIEGSGPQLASETKWLLHQRLRAATLVLVVGFTLFFIRSLFLHKFESLAVLF
jgi:hypothetical protein